MKSKLTLRLDDDLKERAKRLAEERGISVSRLVEDYFRLLLRNQAGGDGSSSQGPDSQDPGQAATGGGSASEGTLSPRIRDLRERLGNPAPEVEMDEDTERWIDAAAEKHR
jgi:predicted transcriptional regulator